MARLKGQLKCPSEALQRLSRWDRTILYGAKDICSYMGFSEFTLRAWIKKHSFPVAKMPNGNWLTSTQLIDDWIVARNPYLAQKLAK